MAPTRRQFLLAGSTAVAAALVPISLPAAAGPVSDTFPSQPPELAREMVGVSHGNVARVRELLAERPSLAKAAWDWGFGDWETALGAASHVGNREIAEVLIAHGARPDLFTAAMLGWLDMVKACVAASPGIQRLKGPHSIPLLAHAEAGGEKSAAVVAYLKTLGDAGDRPPDRPLTPEQLDALVGTYGFGSRSGETLEVARPKQGSPVQLTLRRGEASPRNLFHLGDRVFQPAGAEAVRLRFSAESPAKTLSILEPAAVTPATRIPPL
jgi:hypothetical protein